MMDFFEPAAILGIALVAGLLALLLDRREIRHELDASCAHRLALLFVAGFATLFGTMAILRHNAFHSSGYDLGIFDQVIWNSAHGRLFENSIMADSPSFLGHHFSPLLLVLVPLYWVF
jgi:uncharacterized membrane protein